MKNKNVKVLVNDLIIILFLLFLTITIIPKIVGNKKVLADTLINYSSPLALTIVEKSNNELYPMTDNYAINNLNKSTICITNSSNREINYQLLLKVNKESSIGLNNLKLRIGNNITKLDNYQYEDEGNYYYSVYSSKLGREDNTNVDYLIWLDENTSIITGNNLIYSFEIKSI